MPGWISRSRLLWQVRSFASVTLLRSFKSITVAKNFVWKKHQITECKQTFLRFYKPWRSGFKVRFDGILPRACWERCVWRGAVEWHARLTFLRWIHIACTNFTWIIIIRIRCVRFLGKVVEPEQKRWRIPIWDSGWAGTCKVTGCKTSLGGSV